MTTIEKYKYIKAKKSFTNFAKVLLKGGHLQDQK